MPPPAGSASCPACTSIPPASPRNRAFAGGGEAAEGHANYRDHTVALGDTSRAGLREKARWVLGEMERRMAALGFGWADATAAQAYTARDIDPILADDLVRRGAARHGLDRQFRRPPARDLEHEMDCRGVPLERVLPARR